MAGTPLAYIGQVTLPVSSTTVRPAKSLSLRGSPSTVDSNRSGIGSPTAGPSKMARS